MEAEPVIETLVGELDEVGHGAWGIAIEKLQLDRASFGFHQGGGHGAGMGRDNPASPWADPCLGEVQKDSLKQMPELSAGCSPLPPIRFVRLGYPQPQQGWSLVLLRR